MAEYKLKKKTMLNVFGDALVSGMTAVKDLTVTAVDQAKMVMESPQVKRTKVVMSFAKLGLLGDITALSTITSTMFPLQCRGLKIDYGRKFHESCPTHYTPTFGTSDPYKVWCPLCMDFLEINYPFY